MTTPIGRISLRFASILIPVLLPVLALAQSNLSDVLGMPQDAAIYPIPGLGFVNLKNGNLHVQIPLRVVKDRNGTALTTSITYDNSVWNIVPTQSGYQWTAGPTEDAFSTLSVSTSPNYFGQATNTASPFTCGGAEGQQYTNWLYTDGNGTIHPFAGLVTESSGLIACGPTAVQAAATDGSGYWLEVTGSTGAVVYDKHGNQVSPTKDTNGNMPEPGFKDELGRSLGLPSDFSISTETIYAASHFVYAGVAEFSVSATVPSSITLPDLRLYKFQYDSAGSGDSPGHYGNLTGITLPTGGQITIQTETLPNTGVYPAAFVVESITTPDGTWGFTYSSSSYLITATAPADPTTGVSSQTTFNYSPSGAQVVSIYSATATGTPLRQVTTQYSGQGMPSNITTTLDNGQSNHVAYTYADGCTGRVASKKEYDFSGSLLRETDVSYYTSASDNTNLCEQWSNIGSPLTWTDTYLENGHHITDIPSSITVYGPAGCCSSPAAQTNYTYDSTTLSTTSGPVGTGTSVLGLPTHDDSNFGSSMTLRGNPTVVSQMTSSGNFITTATNYFNILGELVQTVDGRNNATKFDFTDSWDDASCISQPMFAYPTTVTNAFSQLAKTTYNSCDGSTASVRDQNDLNANPARPGTVYKYDGLQRVTNVALPDGGNTQVGFGGSATPEVITTTVTATPSPNQVSATTLDGLGRTLTAVGPNGATVATTYDSRGRVQSVSNPYFSMTDTTYGITSYLYDALGRKVDRCQPDNLNGEASIYCTPAASYQSWKYSGNAVTFTDENKNQWQRTYDGLGRLTQVLEPNGTSTTPSMETDYSYYPLDDLNTVTQWGGPHGTPGGETRSFTYDGLSRLLTASNPETGTVCYGTWSGSSCINGYDANGNLIAKTDARGIVTTLNYDALNRLTSKTYVGGTPATPAANFNYDETLVTVGSNQHSGPWTISNGIGRMTSWYVGPSEPAGLAMKTFSYDPMGRPNSSYECWGPSECTASYGTRNHWRTYDLAGDVTVMANSADRQYNYTYNAAGQVTSLASQLGSNAPQMQIGSITYAPSGQPVERAGIESWSYDRRWRLQSHAQNHGSTVIYGDNVTQYQPNGNVLLATETAEGTSWSWQYTYDTLNRLLTAVSSPVNGANEGCSYSYDSFGNRTGEAAYGTGNSCIQSSYTVTGNRISGFGYDAAGDVTSDGTNSYTYDAEGRIASVTAPGGVVTSYVYGADGTRVEKQTPSGSIYYDYDYDGSLDAMYTLSGSTLTPTTQDVWLNGAHLGFMYESGAALYLSAVDWVGSVRTRVDPSADIISADRNFPFGEMQTELFSPVWGDQDDTIHFTGKERDAESGLDNFGARYYSSNMGRFISPDPGNISAIFHMDDPQSWNGYAYAHNNPLRFTDPTGETYQVCDANGQNCQNLDDQTFQNEQAADQKNGEYFQNGQMFHNDADGNRVNDGSYQQTDVDMPGNAAANISAMGNVGNQGMGAINWFMKQQAINLVGGGAFGAYAETAMAVSKVAELSMLKPLVSNPELREIVEELFQATDTVPGGTAGAVRYEGLTGDLLSPAGHAQEAGEIAARLEKMLGGKGGPSLSVHDQGIVVQLINDLNGAVAGR